jgi:hypothetical protein
MTDARSRKIAVVADSLLDTAIDALRDDGFGVIQLPPGGLDEATTRAWLEQTAEHVAEFRRNAYDVVLVDDGVHTEALNVALAALGVEPLPQYAIHPPSTSRLTPDT